jgi:2-succinyl-6-hydroxy-2,4-cyclohexadiene-1-carboxylate synthase
MSWLLLHGFTGSPDDFSGLVDRSALTASASPACFPVLVPTLGGHLTEPASASFDAEIERLAALAPAATKLFGYSLGGRLALGLVARYPRRFERAVVVSAHPGLRSAAARARRRLRDLRWIELLREDGISAFVAAWERQSLWRSQRALPEWIRSERRRARCRHTAEGLARSLESVGLGQMPNLRPRLARSPCRVDLLAGGADPKFRALAEELQQLVPHARLGVAEHAGHDLVLERPAFCAAYLAEARV